MIVQNRKAKYTQPDVAGDRLVSVNFTDIYHQLFQHYGPQDWWPAEHAFEVIVGAVLTQNTAWRNVEIALDNLRAQNLLTWPSLLRKSADELQVVIRPAGFYRRKAACILSICRWLEGKQGIEEIKQYDSIGIRKMLLSIKGIGHETADAILLYAFEKPAFVIDKYTHRIVCRLAGNTQVFNYHDLQAGFVKQLGEKMMVYQEYHALIVAHAKVHCKKTPDCLSCPINQSCSYYRCKLQA